MRELAARVNVIPVIAKSDTTSKDELARFRQKILRDLKARYLRLATLIRDDLDQRHRDLPVPDRRRNGASGERGAERARAVRRRRQHRLRHEGGRTARARASLSLGNGRRYARDHRACAVTSLTILDK